MGFALRLLSGGLPFQKDIIKVFNNNVEKALKVAKKKLAGEGLFRELKRRRFYEKPSVRKKAKLREAQRRRQKWLSKRKPE